MLTLEVPFADMPPAQLIGGTLDRLWRCRAERGEAAVAGLRLRRRFPPLAPARSLAPAVPPTSAALGLGKLRLAIPEWCEPDWRALMESCWVEDPVLRPSCRQLATHLQRIADMAR